METKKTAKPAHCKLADDPMKPSLELLAKLGSIAVHVEEFFSVGGNPIDMQTAWQVAKSPEVQAWLKAMGPLVPKKR
jgi:hypothetical protein